MTCIFYIPGQAQDYDHWRDLSYPGWRMDDVLPLFHTSERHFGAADAH